MIRTSWIIARRWEQNQAGDSSNSRMKSSRRFLLGAGSVTKNGKTLLVKIRAICGEEIWVSLQNISLLPSVKIKRIQWNRWVVVIKYVDRLLQQLNDETPGKKLRDWKQPFLRSCHFAVLFWLVLLCTSDSVSRVNDSTRVTIFGDSDSTRVTLRKMMTRLESRFSQNDSTRVTINDSSQSHFCKISELLIDKPSLFAYKEMIIFGPVMIKIGANFLFWLSRRVILYPKGQVFITFTEVDPRFAFHWGARRAQCKPIDTSSWSN